LVCQRSGINKAFSQRHNPEKNSSVLDIKRKGECGRIAFQNLATGCIGDCDTLPGLPLLRHSPRLLNVSCEVVEIEPLNAAVTESTFWMSAAVVTNRFVTRITDDVVASGGFH